MSKKLRDLHWKPVALEGFPITSSDSFQGFVGLEECTDYGLDKESKKSKKKPIAKCPEDTAQPAAKSKKKQQDKRKNPAESQNGDVPNKKVKLSNGFIVESCSDSVAPSNTNAKEKKTKKKQKKNNKKLKTEATNTEKAESENLNDGSAVEEVDMSAWAEFRLQEVLVRALAAQGFSRPTHIQQLILPPAIHGRRDILAAAETGSGKTLAFGLPILSGILKLKEIAAATGVNVGDIPYRKADSQKKNTIKEEPTGKPKKGQKKKHKDKQQSKESIPVRKGKKKVLTDIEAKESSEDGYSSGENDSTGQNTENKNANMTPVKTRCDTEEYIEEIEVPVRKRDNSADEGNDSEEDNYLHLSDMLDSDDLADDSDHSNDDDNEAANSDENVDDDDDIESEEDDAESAAEEESEMEDSEEEDVILGGEDEEDVILGGEDEEDVILGGDDEEDVILGGEDEEDVVLGGETDDVESSETAEGPGRGEAGAGDAARPLLALVLTPTRELALQVARALGGVARAAGLRVAAVVGGLARAKQERELRARPELLVATPGRLWELLAQGEPHLQRLHAVRFLAVDEADRMLERGHFAELRELLERLNASEEASRARQTFVLSATLSMVHDLPAHLRRGKVSRHGKLVSRKLEKMTPQQKLRRLVELVGMTQPKVVDLTAQNLGAAASLTEARVVCAAADKDACLYYLVRRHPARTLVFCNSIGGVRRLASLLALLRCPALPLHAGMPQRQRLRNLDRFRAQPSAVLLATDVAARGLDIPGVQHVVHYQVPRTAENYVHRSGRTARAHREGLSVVLVEPAEHQLYARLCRTLRKEREVAEFPLEAGVLVQLRQVVAAARQLDLLELRARRARAHAAWRERARRDLDIILDTDDVPTHETEPGVARALRDKRREVAALAARPLLAPHFSYKFPSLNPAPPALPQHTALQVMKKALESGSLKKEKRKSKNAPLLALGAGGPRRQGGKKFKHKKK